MPKKLHCALRKHALRSHARAVIAASYRQVVVLGARLNTLWIELQAIYPQLCGIEIGPPAPQSGQRQAAEVVGQGIHCIGVDLAQQALGTVVDACPAFRGGAPTVFVAEGLLTCLPLDTVAALSAQMAAAPRQALRSSPLCTKR